MSFAILPMIATAQKTKEVKKTVEVEVIKENNDTKTVIRTTENGKVKEEIFKGKEADAKLKEVQKTYNTNENKDHTLDVEVKEVNGKKTVKVTETINGQTTVTEYEGKAADKKLKELQVPVPPKPKKN
jgi:NADH dehydrogenase/NADH:ubiquinone oxidoreductase subunit G